MAAEEVVGSLAVKLALSSGSFDAGIKRVGTELKSIDSGFRASAAEATAAGERFDTLGQKQQTLAQKLTVQQTATVAYRQQLEQLRQRMATLGTSQTQLKDKVAAAKGTYDQAKQSLKEHQKAGDLTGEEMKQLADRVAELRTSYRALVDQEKQVHGNLARLQGTLSATEAGYNALRVQTAQTRQELARTEAEAKRQASAWGKLEAAAGKYEKTLDRTGKTLNTFGNKASIALTAPVTAGLYKAADAAIAFEDQLAAIGTIADPAQRSLSALGNDLIAISDDTNTAVKSLAEAEYQALSSGIATGKVSGYMLESAKAAKAGMTDLTTAVDGNTSVLNAWGLDASHALDVYNKMIVAQDVGKTTLGEIAGSIGQVAATAAGLKISYTEVLAASAAMTQGGIATNQTMTMLNQVLANVLKPSKEAQKQAQALGLEFDAAAIKSKGLAGFLADVAAKVGDDERAMASLFGSVEAYKAVASLAGAQSRNFADALAAMNNSAGAVERNFQKMSDTTGNKARAALNRLMNQAIKFGDVILPVVNDVLDKVDGLVDGLAGMDAEARKNLLFSASAAALIGPTVKGLGAITSAVSGVAKLISRIGKTGGLMKAIGLAGLPLAAGAAGIALIGLADQFAKTFSEEGKLRQRVVNVGIALDDSSKADFDAKVAEVMEGTEKVLAIKAKISVQKTDLASGLDAAISDGKLTRGENNKLRKEIGAWVDDAIAGVKTDVATKAADITAALDGIAGLSDASKTQIVVAVQQRGDQQIAELQGYQSELDALLASMKGGTEAVTADKIARYNELLDLIATMKEEIAVANEGLDDYYAAQKMFMQSGQATPEQAQAYTKLGLKIAADDNATAEQARKETIIQKQKALQAAQAAADETGDDGSVVTIRQDIQTEFQNEEAAKKAYQDKILSVLNSGVDGAVLSVNGGQNRLSALLDNYLKIGFLGSVDTSEETSTANPTFRKKLQAMLAGLMKVDPSQVDVAAMVEDGTLDVLLQKYKTVLGAKIASEMETGDFNPVMEMLKGSMDGVDLSGIDTSKLSESVKALFGLLDFKTGGGEVSQSIWQGVATGLDENFSIANDAMTKANDSLIAAVKNQWGIQSPSTVMKGIFTNVMLGAVAGITENAALLTAPFAAMVTTEFPQLGRGIMDALIQAVNNRSEAFKAAIRNSVRNALAAAQLVANQGVKIPVTLTYTDSSTKKFSQGLGL